MSLLDSVGMHVSLTSVDDKGHTDMLFPTNTTDDVVIDEDGNTLKEYVVTVDTANSKSPMTGTQIKEDTVPTSALNAILGVS